MEKLIVGIDLCDTYTQAAVLGREEAWMLPTVICRKRDAEEWSVGEDAYKYTLMGEGVIVDKLLSLALKEGTATISSVKYTGVQLLKKFLEQVLGMILSEYEEPQIVQLVIGLKTMEMKLMDELMSCMTELGIPQEQVHIASHTECFVYYVLNQRRDIWGGQVGMFSLSDEDLRYYELKVVRGPRQMTAWAEHEELEEGFNLSVLDTGSGAKMADRILCACGERFLQKKVFSSIFLTGKGFARTDWAPEFMKQICNRRRVFAEPALFAKGAAYKAESYLKKKGSYPFCCICEGKIRSTVTMEVLKRDSRVQIALASAGESWYEAKAECEAILMSEPVVEFILKPMQGGEVLKESLLLDGLPDRPARATRLHIAVEFLSVDRLRVEVKDLGFGELFPSSDLSWTEEVDLSGTA